TSIPAGAAAGRRAAVESRRGRVAGVLRWFAVRCGAACPAAVVGVAPPEAQLVAAIAMTAASPSDASRAGASSDRSSTTHLRKSTRRSPHESYVLAPTFTSANPLTRRGV